MKDIVCVKDKCKHCRRKNIALTLMALAVLTLVLVPTISLRSSYGFYTYNPIIEKLGISTDFIIVQTYKMDEIYDVNSVALHEIGHYVWYNHLSEEQRQEWRNIYDNTTDISEFVSYYASTSVEEDFADTYAAVSQIHYNPYRLRQKSISRSQFFDDYHGVKYEPRNITE